MKPQPATDILTTVAFYERFYEGTTYNIEQRSFRRNDTPGPRLFSRDPKEIEEFLIENGDLKLYFGVATREGNQGTKEHCRELPALFTDLDFKETEEALAKRLLAEFPLRPSLVINSGGGLHVYWLLKQPADTTRDLLKLEAILRGIVKNLHGDPTCAEIARVLRPPGILNWKYTPPRMAAMVESDWGLRYDLADFSRFSAEKKSAINASRNGCRVPVGRRYYFLLARAGEYRRTGDSEEVGLRKVLIDFELSCERSPDDGKKGLEDIRKMVHGVWNYPSVETLAEQKPAITVKIGEYHQAMAEMEDVLRVHACELGIFQRGSEIVRVFRLPRIIESGGLKRPAGTLMLEPVDPLIMLKIFEQLVRFQTVYVADNGKVTVTRINCPTRIARTYLASSGKWRLPTLAGPITAPIMRLDGSILQEPGFDSRTGLYLDSQEKWLAVKDKPTRKDAEKALRLLERPFSQFPFVSAADKSVLLAGILTAIECRLIPACPLLAFSAPVQRTGKTLLAESVAIIATGRTAPGTATSESHEEFRKSLFAALREGQQIINLDNVEHPIKSPELAAIITGTEWKDRLLGESKQLTFPTNCMWTATGNNITFMGDMSVRVLPCRINATEWERPEERTFEISDLKEFLIKHRRLLVHAALTIMKAYYTSDEKLERDIPQWGGFEKWVEFVRKPLIWLGNADPCDTRANAIAEDPQLEIAVQVLTQLKEAFGEHEFESKEFEEHAALKNEKGNAWIYPEVRAAMLAVTEERNGINKAKWGRWMRDWRDHVVNGMRLVRTNKPEMRPAKWKIEEISKGGR
jgi:hypothetical protein